jgi:D-glycero-D-manno-heptose 1,7-bisphosphate phosphatase
MSLSEGSVAAVFLDRDGTVLEEIGYMYDVSLCRVFPWAGEAIRRINESGMRAILATNQSGVARGYFSERMVRRVHDRIQREIGQARAYLDAAYFCPHLPDSGCTCRKPQPGMLQKGEAEFGLDLARSYMVGDRYLDIQTGKAAGTRTILVMTGDGRREREIHSEAKIQPDLVAENLAEAADFIVKNR